MLCLKSRINPLKNREAKCHTYKQYANRLANRLSTCSPHFRIQLYGRRQTDSVVSQGAKKWIAFGPVSSGRNTGQGLRNAIRNSLATRKSVACPAGIAARKAEYPHLMSQKPCTKRGFFIFFSGSTPPRQAVREFISYSPLPVIPAEAGIVVSKPRN